MLVGPLDAHGQAGADTVDAMMLRFAIDTMVVDIDLARRPVWVRQRTGVKLPDAYALATAIAFQKRGHDDVQLESFDKRLQRAYRELRLSSS